MINNENILDAMGMIHEEVVQDAKAYKRPKKHRSLAALIAACLCVTLFGTALAAETIWGVFSAGKREHPDNDRLELFELSMKGTTCFALDELLADIKVLAEQRDNGPDRPAVGRINAAAFENWEKAAEYIGIPLANNSFLAQYPQTETLVGPTTDDDGNPIFLYVSTSYLVDGITVCVDAYLRTDHAEEETVYTPGISYDFSSRIVEDQAYQMSDGSSGMIFKCFDDSFASYHGTFVKDGIFYWILLCSDEGQDNALEQLLNSVMAAY